MCTCNRRRCSTYRKRPICRRRRRRTRRRCRHTRLRRRHTRRHCTCRPARTPGPSARTSTASLYCRRSSSNSCRLAPRCRRTRCSCPPCPCRPARRPDSTSCPCRPSCTWTNRTPPRTAEQHLNWSRDDDDRRFNFAEKKI